MEVQWRIIGGGNAVAEMQKEYSRGRCGKGVAEGGAAETWWSEAWRMRGGCAVARGALKAWWRRGGGRRGGCAVVLKARRRCGGGAVEEGAAEARRRKVGEGFVAEVRRARCGGEGKVCEMLKILSPQKRMMWHQKGRKRGCKKTVEGMFCGL